MENKFFKQALANMTQDAASGDAIRHLADAGYTVDQIANRLTFKTPRERIRKTVWEHYIDKGIISMVDPKGLPLEEVDYVREQNEYGKVSFRRVTKKVERPNAEYIACDFGRQIYKNSEEFEKKLKKLDKADDEYVRGLPWPLETVYHIADERMKRIISILGKEDGL